MNNLTDLLSKTDYDFFILIEDYYINKNEENLNKCLMYYLDNYDVEYPEMLGVLKFLLDKYNFETVVEFIFIGNFEDEYFNENNN